jgi:hypothetical protein
MRLLAFLGADWMRAERGNSKETTTMTTMTTMTTTTLSARAKAVLVVAGAAVDGILVASRLRRWRWS